MAPPPSPIEPLLAALREVGLSVGVAETLRIRALVEAAAASDELPTPSLRDLLVCVVARSREERETLDRVFDAWGQTYRNVAPSTERPPPQERRGLDLVQAVFWTAVLTAVHTDRVQRFLTGPDRIEAWVVTGFRRLIRTKWALALGVCLLVGGVGGLICAEALIRPAVDSASGPSAGVAPTPGVSTVAVELGTHDWPRQYRARQLVFTVEAPTMPSWAVIVGLSAAALAMLGVVSRYLRIDRYVPRYVPRRLRVGPEVQPLLPLARGSSAGLLSATERSDLAFAVDRFVRDDPSAELDVRRSIDATVTAGGRAYPVFRPHTEHRTVWLWTDVAAETPLVARFVGEAHAALASAGLPCERASYHVLPDSLERAQGGLLAPRDLDAAAHGSAVLLVTDGAALARKLAQRAALEFAAPVLRLLARWPRVALVAVTPDGVLGLAPLTRRFGLTVLGPDDVEGFLQGVDVKPSAPSVRPPLAGDVLAWGAGCALCERPVDVASALALREAMNLEVAPWALDVLLGESQSAGTLHVANERRVAWLRWLAGQTLGGTRSMPVPPASPLAKALAFWRGRLREEDARRSVDPAAQGDWKDTPAARRVAEELARLDLWDAPKGAAERLRELHGPPEPPPLRSLLRGYAVQATRQASVEVPRDVMLLPWVAGEQQGSALTTLAGYGLRVLGATGEDWKLEVPGRALLAFGIAMGVLLGAAGGGTLRKSVSPLGEPTCLAPEGASCVVVSEEQGYRARVTLLDNKGESEVLPAGAVVHVTVGAEVAREDPAEPIQNSRDCPYREETVDGIVLVRVCGGTFRMGDDLEAGMDEKPAHDVQVSTFWIGKFEVSLAQFRRTDPTHFRLLPGMWNDTLDLPDESGPAQAVTWYEAAGFCDARGLRLPTSEEWEYSARGPESRRYPWGEDEPSASLAAISTTGRDIASRPVVEFATVGSPFGTVNQWGSVAEWVQDCYADTIGSSGGTNGSRCLQRDMGWLQGIEFGSGFRTPKDHQPGDRNGGVGFRCARGGAGQP